MNNSILILDDDNYICDILDTYLSKKGFQSKTAYNKRSAQKYLSHNHFDLVLCDYRLPDSNGYEILKLIKEKYKDTKVIIMTAYADVRLAVKLIKAGAYDYVTKPIHHEEILDLIKKALSDKQNSQKFDDGFIESEGKEFQHILYLAGVVAPTDMSVIIEGETGIGKEFFARKIHQMSNRSDKPFIAIDCGAIPKELAGSELFGHIKGAFTGAINNKEGFFQAAHQGTIFLDEIGNLPYDVQVKLLRALQEKVISKIGDNRSIKVDVRVLVATNENLSESIEKKKFREDLYHRLNEFKIYIPPLRERKQDILFFAKQFIEDANIRLHKKVAGLSDDVRKIFLNYEWYGNLRELKNIINRCVLLNNTGIISTSDLPGELVNTEPRPEKVTPKEHSNKSDTFELKGAANLAEKEVILNALATSNYNKSKAARLLNIDRKTLYNKMNLYDIEY